ncbi:MAG: zinc ABC transporter substrate-binding protein [Bacteroidales bacterium]|nr:zinc ABC transporter substrate-binding protein [Bacteroidales bacterium]
MRGRIFIALVALLVVPACGNRNVVSEKDVISVSIAPFRYFTEAIAGDDFTINVMVPAGADPHVYEPSVAQVQELGKSVAYVSNGYLDFELAWLYRFYQVNPSMKIISFANNQDLLYLSAWEHGDHMHYEGVDPHFWVSPKAAYRIVSDIRDLLVTLKPESASKYQENYTRLVSEISALDREIMEMLTPWSGGSFMIYHPVLGYFARDYGLIQIAVEHEGKEPSPAEMASLIDKVRELGIKTIFVQQEFDSRNAGVIASQTGATVVTIDPLSSDWNTSVRNIANALAGSLAGNK